MDGSGATGAHDPITAVVLPEPMFPSLLLRLRGLRRGQRRKGKGSCERCYCGREASAHLQKSSVNRTDIQFTYAWALYACSKRAMSILSICSIAFMTFLDFSGSLSCNIVPRTEGTICQERPYLS